MRKVPHPETGAGTVEVGKDLGLAREEGPGKEGFTRMQPQCHCSVSIFRSQETRIQRLSGRREGL